VTRKLPLPRLNASNNLADNPDPKQKSLRKPSFSRTHLHAAHDSLYAPRVSLESQRPANIWRRPKPPLRPGHYGTRESRLELTSQRLMTDFSNACEVYITGSADFRHRPPTKTPISRGLPQIIFTEYLAVDKGWKRLPNSEGSNWPPMLRRIRSWPWDQTEPENFGHKWTSTAYCSARRPTCFHQLVPGPVYASRNISEVLRSLDISALGTMTFDTEAARWFPLICFTTHSLSS